MLTLNYQCTPLGIAEEIQTSPRSGELGRKNVFRVKGVGRFGVVNAIPAHVPSSRLAGYDAAVAAPDVRVVVVWRPAIPAAHHQRILET